jgi:hypothetical protein
MVALIGSQERKFSLVFRSNRHPDRDAVRTAALLTNAYPNPWLSYDEL